MYEEFLMVRNAAQYGSSGVSRRENNRLWMMIKLHTMAARADHNYLSHHAGSYS